MGNEGPVAIHKTEGVPSVYTFWSSLQTKISIPGVAADTAGPSIVVPSIFPTGATIKRVELILKYRKVVDASGSANKLKGNQNVQVKESASGSWTTGITLKDDMMAAGASAESGGDVIIGDTDVKAEVDSDNATYAVQIASAVADGATLDLQDVQFGLKFTLET